VRLIFVHHVVEDRGSAQDMHNYVQVARALGHEVVLYGPPDPASAFTYSLDLESADGVIFIFEWTTQLLYGDPPRPRTASPDGGSPLDYLRLVGRVPRERRVVIDCDGKYNDAIDVLGDANHEDPAASRDWMEVCDSLSDKILQPTLHPLRPNVRPFFFHAYNPAWEVPLDFSRKDYGIYLVGNNWFRWRSVRRLLEAVEPVRAEVGRIGLMGIGWESPGPWANPTVREDAYYTDPQYLRELGVEVMPPVRFDRVVDNMSRGIVNPVIYRPLFDRLRLVTCRTFETPAANTLPLFCQRPEFVREIYGDDALELLLPEERPHEKIVDLVRRPQHYAAILRRIRARLSARHSYAAQLQRLVEVVRS
jgi:hypothetical protein